MDYSKKIGHDTSIYKDKMNKGIRQQMEDNINLNINKAQENYVKENYDSFLEDLNGNNEPPEDMEVFVVDMGWCKIKNVR